MLTYLFDASAALEIYMPRNEMVKRAVRHILAQKATHRSASMFIPSFCIAELFNTLARKFFKPIDQEDAISEEDYKRHLTDFRNHVHWGRTLYPYELSRYHIIGADMIIPVEHRVAKRYAWDHLSTFDILIIAMACELAYVGNREDTYLLTCDRRLSQVFSDLRENGVTELLVEGPLGELEQKRWIPPHCVYLPEVKKSELRSVLGQSPINF